MTTLLVASAGGHLLQLQMLATRFEPSPDQRHWVTYDTPQARTLLEGESMTPAYWPTTRSLSNAVRNYRLAGQVLRQRTIVRVVSTGAGIAVPFVVQARRRRIPAHYIESVTRVLGPSLSGRILERVPGVNLYGQHESFRARGWRFQGSIFDTFTALGSEEPRNVRTIVVTVGTHRFAFPALVAAVRSVLEKGDVVVWQLGPTPGKDLPGDVWGYMDYPTIEELMRTADVVVGHAGAGTALTALLAGRVPVLVPRRRSRGEHIDDHQVALSQELGRRGLAIVVEPDRMTRHTLERAATLRTERAEPPPFGLADR